MIPTWEWVKQFPRIGEEDIVQFARTISDPNPLHCDKSIAIAKGLKGVIAPGVMVMGYLSSAIAEEIPGAMVTGIQNLRFKNPLYAGVSPLVLCAKERGHGQILQVRFEIRSDDNGNSNSVLAQGCCTLVLPGLPIY